MKGASTRFAASHVAGAIAAAVMAVAGCVTLVPMVDRTPSVAPTASVAPVQEIILAAPVSPIPAPSDVSSPVAPPTVAQVPTPSTVPSPVLEPSATPSSEDVFVEAQVTEVIDGDTIRVTVGDEPFSVRYIGINAPESDTQDERLKALAADATAKNSELVSGQIVHLERDESETDDFGRLLRYVWVGDLMVNKELMRLGYARAAAYNPDVKHQAEFMGLQQQAQAANLGVWQTTQPVVTEDADLWSGPGRCYEQRGKLEALLLLELVAQNQEGDWYQLAGGAWILAQHVWNAPDDLPVATVTSAPEVPSGTQTPGANEGVAGVEIVDLFRDGIEQNESDEYVKIQNLGSQSQDMTGWRLESERRGNDSGQIFHFRYGFVIEPGQTCRIYTNEDHPESCGLSFQYRKGGVWNNDKPDAALLFDNAGSLVSKCQ